VTGGGAGAGDAGGGGTGAAAGGGSGVCPQWWRTPLGLGDLLLKPRRLGRLLCENRSRSAQEPEPEQAPLAATVVPIAVTVVDT
jgi:hypothetical protein